MIQDYYGVKKMDIEHKVIRKRKSSLFILWLIPLIAFGIAVWTLYEHFEKKGTDIVIVFDSAEGFQVGVTTLKYKGIDVGTVTKIVPNNTNVEEIYVTVNVMDEAAEAIPRESTRFWKVQPTISLSGISGLNTIVSGNYIACMTTGKSIPEIERQPKKYFFYALDHQPIDAKTLGFVIKLKATDGALSIGTPILYKKFVIGRIVNYELKDKMVEYQVSINDQYAYLLKANSKFWKMNAVEIEASLSGIKMQLGSLDTLLTGGILMSSPDDGDFVEENREFTLYNDKESTKLNTKAITLDADQGYNLTPGSSHIYYQGVKAGMVRALNYDVKKNRTSIKIQLYDEFRELADDDAYFWIVQPQISLSGIENIDAVLTGPYITFTSHKAQGSAKYAFKLHKKPPPIEGVRIRLVSESVGSLTVGSGIYYEDMPIGMIESIRLSKNKKNVNVGVVIKEKHKKLVNDSSIFYLNSGINFSASITGGVQFQTGSLEDLLRGGISVDTTSLKRRLSVKSFKLINSFKEYQLQKYYQGGGRFFILEAKDASSLSVGIPIFYKSLKVGHIKDFYYNPSRDAIDIEIYIEPKYKNSVTETTKFYNISGMEVDAGLNGIKVKSEPLAAVIRGGITYEDNEKSTSADSFHRYILFKDKESAFENNFNVELEMASASGLAQGSAVLYKEIQIGKVSDITLQKESVVAHLSIEKPYRYLFKEDSMLWLSTFSLGLNGIKNVKNALLGNSVVVLPGKSQTFKSRYTLSTKPPSKFMYKEGLRVVLKGSRRSSLDRGSPVYYRQVQIGEIESYRLSSDSKSVEMMVFIEACYAHLVRNNTLFYNATALGFDISLLGVKVQTETLETMISGGISMVTPEDFGAQAEPMQYFLLYNAPDEAWLEWSPTLKSSNETCSSGS